MIKTSQRIVLGSAGGNATIRGIPMPVPSAFGTAVPEHMELSSTPTGLGLPAGAGTSSISSPAMLAPLMEGFIVDDPVSMNRLFREIHAYDPTVGSTIDLLSTLPLGDFSLTAINDERRLQKYAQAIDNMKIRQLLPSMSTDYLTLGSFLATTKWDSSKSNFVSLSPQNIDFAKIEMSPIWGDDPIVKLTIPRAVIDLLNSGRPEAERFRDLMPQEYLDSGSPEITIDPKNLIFLARKQDTASFRGVSAIKRCLPICLMDRALTRGTLDLVWKRQRSIMHIMMGEEDWKPVRADYDSVAALFAAADHDPAGAIIATRHGIDVNLIDRANEGLKYNDFYDFAQQVKLRALGLSDGMFSIDANVSVAEGSINLAMKHLEAYRNNVSHELFYRNVFPSIAVANNYRRQQSVVLSSGARVVEDIATRRTFEDPTRKGHYVAEFSASMPENLSDIDLQRYAMPRVEWHTNLEPSDTAAKMDMLTRLTEQGIPIPLRQWASAAGLTLSALAEQRDADIRTRKWLKPWRKAIAADKAMMDGSAQQGGGEDDDSADTSSMVPGVGGTRRRSLLDRKMDVERSVPMIETGGKLRPRSKAERDRYNDKGNRVIAAATSVVEAAKLRERNARHAEEAPRKYYTSKAPKKAR